MGYLTIAILLDVFGTIALKMSNGMTRLGPSALMAIFYILSVFAFAYALEKVEIGVAYALWTGLATVAVVGVGIFYFNEPADAIKIMSIALVIIGVIGINLSAQAHQ